MENIKHVGLVVHRQADFWQGTRTALGLAVGNFYAYLFLVDMPEDIDEKIQENLEWLVEDMECECWSNIRYSPESLVRHMPTGKIAKKLKEMDIVIPFGNRRSAPMGRLPILWLLDN